MRGVGLARFLARTINLHVHSVRLELGRSLWLWFCCYCQAKSCTSSWWIRFAVIVCWCPCSCLCSRLFPNKLCRSQWSGLQGMAFLLSTALLLCLSVQG